MSKSKLRFIVDRAGSRLDKYISEHCKLSRSYAQKLISDGFVSVNDQLAKPGLRLSVGDKVVANLPPPAPTQLVAEEIPLKIVYEDRDLLVVDKPAGLAVHPAPGHPSHTLVNALLAHCPDLAAIGGTLRPGIVHRLDKNTSGLMMVAKNNAAQMNLSSQIKDRSIVKRYLALVVGRLSPEQGVVEALIGRDTRNRKRMAVVSGGREARTQYRVLRYVGDYSLLEVTPETGRTHQVRVHFSAIHHPIFGDSVYGKGSPLLPRHFLHAHYIGFRLPSSGEFVEFTTGLPPELEDVLERFSGATKA